MPNMGMDIIERLISSLESRNELTPMSLALEILSFESRSYLVVVRGGDNDPARRTDQVPSYMIADTGVDARLRKYVQEWLQEKGG